MTTRKTGGNDKETTRQKEGKNREAIGNATGNSRGITRILEGSNGKKKQGDNKGTTRKQQEKATREKQRGRTGKQS